jgi:pimeloyl-ACP methyl ester carboxylesterase
MTALRRLAAALLCLLAQGCASRIENADRLAREFGFEKLRLPGAPFEHVAYFRPASGDTTLHVYIEHDGTPWRRPTTPSADPTPDNPLMLGMMSQDPAPSLYLGRPCYFGTAARPPCEPVWWTHRRFSPEVVASMVSAITQFLRAHAQFATVHLFGYSGGGVLAALLASEIPSTRRLVTIAAPLDTDGWIRLHGYSPMEGSISPMSLPPLPSVVSQLHLAGAEDRVVPADLIKPFVQRQPAARFLEIRGFGHRCCWVEAWPTLALPKQ